MWSIVGWLSLRGTTTWTWMRRTWALSKDRSSPVRKAPRNRATLFPGAVGTSLTGKGRTVAKSVENEKRHNESHGSVINADCDNILDELIWSFNTAQKSLGHHGNFTRWVFYVFLFGYRYRLYLMEVVVSVPVPPFCHYLVPVVHGLVVVIEKIGFVQFQ